MNQQPNKTHLPKSIDALVHLGAGRCSGLDEYIASTTRQVTLVEADPQLAESVAARCAELAQVQVVNAAVSGHPGAGTYHRYNLPDVSSLHRASAALLEIYPGLQQRAAFPVTTLAPSSLVAPLELQSDEENLLIVDTPGEELPVLQALQQAGQLELFRHLQLYCGKQALYEGSATAADALRWLQAQGFDLLMEDDSADPDRPCWTLQRNTLLLHYRELQARSAQLTLALEEQVGLNEAQQTEIDELSRARDAQAKLAEERQVKLNELVKARDTQTQLVNDQQVQIDNLTKVRDDQSRLVQETQLKLDQLILQNERLAKELAEQKQHQAEDEKQRQELDYRQGLMDEELLKAEAQIDLIKDILIREKEF